VLDNVQRLLEFLERRQAKATFFVLGDVAQRWPQLAPRIHGAGHEVASHGFGHDHLARHDPQSLRQDVRAAKALLEDQIGQPVLGYRAPTWSLTRRTSWAVDVLAEAGFFYDASVFPVRHPNYGVPDAPVRPYWLVGSGRRRLLELPPLVWRASCWRWSANMPAAGGAYFRLLPLALMDAALRQAARQDRPALLYFHPWEFDRHMPRLPLGWRGRLRTYGGIQRALPRLQRLLSGYDSWSSIAQALPALTAAADRAGNFSLSSG
jgi:polysaccharide deacetylase family protein (PEP-CTERM system associated)